jgi:hypothetical protein
MQMAREWMRYINETRYVAKGLAVDGVYVA